MNAKRSARIAVTAALVALLAGAFLVMPGCGGETAKKDGDEASAGKKSSTPPSGDLAARLDSLGLKLVRQVAAEDGMRNIFLSPTSLEMCLAMTMNGAEGKTFEAIAKSLELTGMSRDQVNSQNKQLKSWLEGLDPKVTLEIANSLWGREGIDFSKEFLALNTSYYDAKVESLDFSSPDAAATMNRWVSEATHGKIDEMVKPPIDPQTILFLMNALYFKGKWTEQFKKEDTSDKDFFVEGKSAVKVPMMSQSGEYRYLENDSFQAVRLPYGDGKVSMYIFLPKDRNGMGAFLDSLTPENWKAWMSGFRNAQGSIEVPRFKVEYEKLLNETLKAFGMGVAFTEQAEFPGIADTGGEKIYISDVKQKTYVDVNEEGTEAAAVTSTEMKATAAPGPSEHFEMRVDHPFYFAIRDDAGGVTLFNGVIVKP